MSRRAILLTLIGLLLLALIGWMMVWFVAAIIYGHVGGHRVCNYQPVDAQGETLSQWSETVNRVRFSMRPLSLPLGSSGIICLEITNDSDQDVVVRRGQVLTYGRTIEAKVDDSPEELLMRTVPIGQSKVVCLFWEFGTWLDEVLGQEITWVWNVKIGKTEHSLQIPMLRK